jgi:formylmethanofuran dehydrogenase subunit E
MNTTTATEVPDTCSKCGAYDLPIEVLNGKPFCEECADELSA